MESLDSTPIFPHYIEGIALERNYMNRIFTALLFFTFSIYAEDLEGITTPSADVSASFTTQALITELKVKEGEFVKKGQLLAVQEREAQQNELIRLNKEASAMALIDKAKIEIEFFKKDFASLSEAMKKGATSQKEINDVELALKTAELALQEAKFNKEVATLKVKELKSRLKQFELRTPVDGIIEKLSIDTGEAPRPGEEHIRIVSIDPMWVEILVPRNIAMKLKNGASATVTFTNAKISRVGQIIFISPVADTASDTVRVKVELTNPNKRLVGERVLVDFKVK
jgi:RND family efflux transporter MFP subunit